LTELIDDPVKTLGSSLVGMLEMIAGIPFKDGADTLLGQEFMLFTNAIADLSHHRIPGLFFFVPETEIDGRSRWLVRLGIRYPLWIP
jgi:hypothetical protein